MLAERLDMFSASLPRKCLWCRWGYPVVFGRSYWLDAFVCGRHAVDAFATKRIELRLTEEPTPEGSRRKRGLGYMVAPITGPWDSCDGFQPVAFRPSRPGEFVNARKLDLLDRSGMLDDMGGRDGKP